MVALVLGFSLSTFAAEPNWKHHIVKKGDTLSGFAYSCRVSIAKMIEWNPKTGINLIYPGQKLRYLVPPDIIDVIGRINEVIGTMDTIVPIIQQSDSEIKKIIRENHDGLTRQIGQVQAKQKQNTDITDIKDTRIMDLAILAISLFVVVCIVWFLIFRFRKEGNNVKICPDDLDKIYKITNGEISGPENYKCCFCNKMIQKHNLARHVTKRCKKSPYYEQKINKEEVSTNE